ncbi:DUF1189 family protein [Caproiciproducens sp. MSJ-32]|uniref:DUF1189 family protein n=1 Tax=Caproiciproducens sp. MSJ-32 TaxID=2841527 RepID=UPI001C113B99|nr:DUF1189 family protein [Caproiciproducens sp. MSJ-32]MBU5455510.1 DUF1189 domain-containing protein [Caproiciproducens sp. MSJ-32]
MKEKIRFIDIFKISLFSPSKYKELIKLGIGRIILYIFIISMIVGTISGINQALIFSKDQKELVSLLEKEEYSFEITEGILYFKNSPRKIDMGQYILYIDTSKELKDLDSLRNILIHKDYSIAILKDGIGVNFNGTKTNLNYKESGFLSLTNKELIKFVEFMNILVYIGIFIYIIAIFIGTIIDAVLLSFLAFILLKAQRINLTFDNVFKLSICSMTLSTIILPAIITLVNLSSSVGMYIGGFYLFLAIRNIKRSHYYK